MSLGESGRHPVEGGHLLGAVLQMFGLFSFPFSSKRVISASQCCIVSAQLLLFLYKSPEHFLAVGDCFQPQQIHAQLDRDVGTNDNSTQR